MIKTLFAFSTLLITLTNTYALKYEINHPCSEKQSAHGNIIVHDTIDALTLTHGLANTHKITIEVLEGGIKGFYNLPGNSNLEILSNNTFKAYGWCYSVNDVIPDTMPKEYLLQDSDQIKWFLGSSTYQSGEWIDYCTPVKNDNTFICK